ncbi:MAG: PqqD family protein [Lachnospiraceae bacterium]|nr:PqqD family protein [Lachnospiraceae bacterium]
MKLVSGFCVRRILDETVAVPTQEAAHRLSGLIAMNETGEFLFQLLQSTQTKESLVRALLETYETDETTAERDVTAFLEILRKDGLLEE